MTSETILAVGLEAIGQGVGAENRAVWQAQIGVTRVGAGGRALPRCRNGRMTTPGDLVASTIEPQELVSLPRPPRRTAPLARAIVFLAVAVVTAAGQSIVPRKISPLAGLVSAIWRAIMPPRRVVSERARQAWRAARDMGIDLPCSWRFARVSA